MGATPVPVDLQEYPEPVPRHVVEKEGTRFAGFVSTSEWNELQARRRKQRARAAHGATLVGLQFLAEQLGSFAGQLTETGITEIKIEYEGHVAELNCRPLTQAMLHGLLKPMLDAVNMVNAPVLARERDIDVAEVKHDRDSDYQTLMRMTVKTERQERSVAGTLFGGDKPRIVEIKGIKVEAALGPHMLYVTNRDEPGLIGGLGSILGDAGMNIATGTQLREQLLPLWPTNHHKVASEIRRALHLAHRAGVIHTPAGTEQA